MQGVPPAIRRLLLVSHTLGRLPICLLAGVLLFPAEAAAARDRELIEITTPEFVVYSVLPEKATRNFAATVSAFQRVVASAALASTRRGAGPARIYLVSNRDWDRYFQPREGIVGFFTDYSGFGNDMIVPVGGSLSSAYPKVFHEYAHFILRTQTPMPLPLWFDEGLAELLSTARLKQDRLLLTIPEGRLNDLHYLPWMPIERVFHVTKGSREYRTHRLAAAFYAQSWLIMHYAYIGHPPFLRQVVDYLLRVNRGEPVNEAAQAAFGRSFEELDAELRRYANQPRFRHGEIPVPPNREVENVPVRRLGALEAARELGELGLRMGMRKRVVPLFEEALSVAPDDAASLAALAYIAASTGDPEAADAYLARITRGTDDPRLAALLGRAHLEAAFRVGKSDAGENDGEAAEAAPGNRQEPDLDRLRIARDLFRKALAPRADDLLAADGFATACMRLNDCLEEAHEALTRAQAAAPVNWLMAYDLARLNQMRGDQEAAAAQWRLLARVAGEAELRDHALEQLGLRPEGDSSGEHADAED